MALGEGFSGDGKQPQQPELPEPTETPDYLREGLEGKIGETDKD